MLVLQVRAMTEDTRLKFSFFSPESGKEEVDQACVFSLSIAPGGLNYDPFHILFP